MYLNNSQKELVNGLTSNIEPNLGLKNAISDLLEENGGVLLFHQGDKRSFALEYLKNLDIDLFLEKLKNLLADILVLIQELEEEHLILTYPVELSEGTYSRGLKFQDSNSKSIFLCEYVDYTILEKNLEIFYSKDVLPRQILTEFKNNNYRTFIEITIDEERTNRRTELKYLQKQTQRLMYGIIVPAVITFIAALLSIFLSQPKSKDIYAISDSIKQLTMKVDQLNTNHGLPGTQGYDSQFIIPDDTIVPVQLTSPEFHKKED